MKTDFRGYTNYGYLTPYRENKVEINPVTLPNDAEITNNIVSVIPTKGAVVLAKFNARIGGRLFLHLKRSDNKPVPFGSIVTIEGQSSSSGIVGDNSGVYLTGLPKKSKILVKWGRDKNQSCSSNVVLPEKNGYFWCL